MSPSCLALVAPPLSAIAQDSLPLVTVAAVAKAPFRQEIALTGSLVAREEVKGSTATSGKTVTELMADLGDTVDKGAVLARLDDRSLQAKLAQTQAEEACAVAALSQPENAVISVASALKQAGASAACATVASNRSGVAAAGGWLAVARAALRLAEKYLADATIVAPAAGVISAHTEELGQVVVAGQELLFRILRDGEIALSAQALESDLVMIASGQMVSVTLARFKVLPGKVRLVLPIVDPVSSMGTQRISLTDPEGVARAGMVPSTLAHETDGEFRAPMAVIGGLILSTGLSLIFVPSLFSAIECAREWVSNLPYHGRKLSKLRLRFWCKAA